MYRSWIIEQRGYDLANTEVEELLGATHASARLDMETRFDERLKRRPTDHNGPDIA
jgi:hypothetical protein